MSFNIGGGIKMSLIICPECGREVSSMAKACPQCGYPVEENTVEYQVRETIKEQSPVKAIEVLESRGYSPEEAHEYVWNYIEKYPGTLEYKIEKILKVKSPIWAMQFLKEQGYSSGRARKYVMDYIEKNPRCSIHEPPQPAPLQCPNCGSTNIVVPAFSLYDHKCKECKHMWVQCPICKSNNVNTKRYFTAKGWGILQNTCNNCGRIWSKSL